MQRLKRGWFVLCIFLCCFVVFYCLYRCNRLSEETRRHNEQLCIERDVNYATHSFTLGLYGENGKCYTALPMTDYAYARRKEQLPVCRPIPSEAQLHESREGRARSGRCSTLVHRPVGRLSAAVICLTLRENLRRRRLRGPTDRGPASKCRSIGGDATVAGRPGPAAVMVDIPRRGRSSAVRNRLRASKGRQHARESQD